jgi:outer membrane receptor protein involved in Fe transport
MTNAPAYLYNIYGNYDIRQWGTSLSLYYSVKGDTLIAGAGGGTGGIVIPSVYETEYGTLNFGITQKIGKHVNVSFQAKNITNQPVQTVYRGNGLNGDILKTSYTKGVDLSISVGVKFDF